MDGLEEHALHRPEKKGCVLKCGREGNQSLSPSGFIWAHTVSNPLTHRPAMCETIFRWVLLLRDKGELLVSFERQ